MRFPEPALFSGTVVHRRVNPVFHVLKYSVFSVLVDLDDIAAIARRSRLFSHNRFNVLSIYDRDHTDGEVPDLAWFARDLVSRRLGFVPDRVLMLTFPRIFGYAFNPLTVYFCLDADGAPIAIIYEVNNTFGGRTHYVCRATPAGANIRVDDAAKRMLVSPFNGAAGRYGFRLAFDEEHITLGVALREGGRPILNTSHAAERLEATDRNILRLVVRMPLMTAKVIAAIHFEALRLWLKGLRPPRPVRQMRVGDRGKVARVHAEAATGPGIPD